MREIDPAFKFLKNEHAQKLLLYGNVHIPTLYGFRDAMDYSGKILDAEEGTFYVSNKYTEITVRDDNSFGLLSHPAFAHLRGTTLVKAKLERTYFAADVNIYCTTSSFFSETLDFAVEENKDSCIFITDMVKFVNLISEQLKNASFRFLFHCIYGERIIDEVDPTERCATAEFLKHRVQLYITKPWEYRNQNEIRAVWSRNDNISGPLNIDVPTIKDLCIEIRFKQIFDHLKSGLSLKSLSIHASIHYKDGKIVPAYTAKAKTLIFTPLSIEDNDGNQSLYFKRLYTLDEIQNNTIFLKDAILYAPYGVGAKGGDVVGPFELDNINFINYSIVERETSK